jgi:hypothetical protein
MMMMMLVVVVVVVGVVVVVIRKGRTFQLYTSRVHYTMYLYL